jgi:6-hydroxycyclohex-1-ene-1-carbonyl-CoA dehydrogenase
MSHLRGAYGFELVECGRPLRRRELGPLRPGPDQVLVEVEGCGVCHTDLGFAVEGVPTRHALPLILGHEISGLVVETGERATRWEGCHVIVPAVIPCGDCPACRAGRTAVCRKQFMPGNDGDGGFATHVVVPARGLCRVPDELPPGLSRPDLAVVADAVTTPYEAIHLSGLGAQDVAVFVGTGGVGGFGVQIAAARGAAVVAIDVDPLRLKLARGHGAGLALDARELDARALKSAVREFARDSGRTGIGLKVFETSGTPQGQVTAFSLVDFGGWLGVVGYTPEKVQLRLSNLMALDATARGNWGCPPERYPQALQLVLDGKVRIGPFVEYHALSDVPEVLDALRAHELHHRPVLIPDHRP